MSKPLWAALVLMFALACLASAADVGLDETGQDGETLWGLHAIGASVFGLFVALVVACAIAMFFPPRH